MKPKAPSGDSGLTTSPLAEATIAKVLAQGIQLPQLPLINGEPLIPQLTGDITLLSSEALGRLHSQMTSAADYMSSRVVTIEVVCSEAKLNYDLEYARVRFVTIGTVVERDDTAKLDPTVIRLKTRLTEVEAELKFMTVLLRNYERDMAAVSREITRRQEWQRRSANDVRE
jgi:hypothetical protein